MKIKVGILGLPNVGKSTLFNALSQRSLAHAANFPFCTIDPNVAPIPVPDPYLSCLGELSSSSVTKPAVIEWIDVAGLAKGAHRGEGLGNRFLATLRECDALCHVVRTFPDPNVVHVDGKVEPVSDAESINLELLYADLAHVQRRLKKKTCVDMEQKTLMHILKGLETGIPARSQSLSNEQLQSIKSMGLLTLKPVLYTFNVDEVDFCYRKQAMEDARVTMESIQYCDPNIDKYTIVSAKIEAELGLKDSNEEKMEYLASKLDMDFDCDDEREKMEKCLCYNILPSMVMELLKIYVVYTGPGVPPERSRTTKAYLLSQPRQRQSITAIQFAGRLHGDIQKGFVNAEVVSATDLMLHNNYVAAKQAGFVRTEGADYILTDNDVVLIKW
eukprot:CAMPEP_0178924620 /NCGR_PEP_ID=MMETSP0786-20121207/17432_1 /TAXON_ID=186022 /ORGANISM="Thalassionema frauenfeldii, Strain CCMP 1798" /LENGTH=386 /DNA_ID=CAMNT_0020599359 /DNA_START=385 /DNA_END=1542 /DNA_ORIENTATION=+